MTQGARYIALEGKHRDDGSMFVTSPNLPFFSTIVADADWNDVLPHLREFLQENFGAVGSLTIVPDASELIAGSETGRVPPAHVIAEIAAQHVGSR